MTRVAIVGLPNTGKSHVYNELTGDYSIVANYPLTTIEIQRKEVEIRGQLYEIADTPGLHRFYVQSEEERAVRDFVYDEIPDGIIQCVDANRIRKSLAFTIDLLELGLPMAICLTSIDDTSSTDVSVGAEKLSRYLGLPVVDLAEKRDIGDRLRDALCSLSTGGFASSYGEEIDRFTDELSGLLSPQVAFPRSVALMAVEGEGIGHDLIESRNRSAIDDLIHLAKKRHVSRELRNRRELIVQSILKGVGVTWRPTAGKLSVAFASASRHPVFGFPILTAIVVLTYLFVVEGAGALQGLLSRFLVDPALAGIAVRIKSPFLSDLLIGNYGVLTLGLFNAFVTVLPILTAFFLVLGTLEDIGYLPNLSVLTRRALRHIGLTGRSVMSLVLGFGCKTMATLTTKSIRSKKERTIAIYLIAFAIPCSAQLAIDMAILGKMGPSAFVIAFAALGIVEIGAGLILNRILPSEEGDEFIQELPPIRRPDLSAIVKKTGYRVYWFLKEAVPIFLIASLVLFLIDWIGILGFLKDLLRPVVTGWLGLPLDIVEVLILSLARHEAAAGLLLKMANSGALSYVQSIVAVVITTMFVPCFANIVAMCRQMGLWKGLGMTLVINVSSFIFAGILNWILIGAGL